MDKKNAYVWLLMRGDSYMPGILVSAYSILQTKSSHDLVVMITEDVSEEAIKIMNSYGIQVYKVPYIRFKVADILTDKQKKILFFLDELFFYKMELPNINKI